MPTGYQIKDQDQLYFLTLTVVQWVDIFIRQSYRDIIINSLKYCIEHKQLEVYGFVIMSNHIHLLVKSGCGKLSDTIRDFKSYTAKEIIAQVKLEEYSRKEWILRIFAFEARKRSRDSIYQMWMHQNHAVHVYSNRFIEQKLNYIHQNPVKAGWVDNENDYVYSSARNYLGQDGILPVETLQLRWKTV
jgi:REP element-mobilizing transposase RayT